MLTITSSQRQEQTIIPKPPLEKHNELQAAITRDFMAHFMSKGNLLYLENGVHQTLVFEKEAFLGIGVTLVDFRGLPDIILLDAQKNWLFLIQAVTVGSPKTISSDRHTALEELFENCAAGRVYVNAFLDFATFRNFIDDLAEETEVWVAEAPSHIMRFRR